MRVRSLALLAGWLLLGASSVSAQVAWDSPQLMPSRPPSTSELGIFLMDAAGGGVGVLGTWRGGLEPNLGLRFGLAEGRRRPDPDPPPFDDDDDNDGIDVFGGLEVMGTLTRASNDFPLDVAWVLGAGISIGDRARLSFPGGLSVGHTFSGDGVTFHPYLTPRIVLDAVFGRGDDLDLDLAVDLGIDIAFQPTWLIRFGGTFGDREAIAIGVVF